ncbi:MAG: hypothetical protein JWO62_3419, partial [Acidimicrobiaceae bacterium]|nr:hypothetical protein [Acidimicrobiaceae bacterium]
RTTVMALLLVSGSSGGALIASSVAATSASASTTFSAASGTTSNDPVACGANGSCVSIGYNATNSAIAIDVLSGKTWTSVAIGLPAGAGTATQQNNGSPAIWQVACASATSCVGVGTIVDSGGITQALLVTGSGTSWTDRIAPLPAGAIASGSNEGQLQGVACSSSTCTAVGNFHTSGGDVPLVLSGSGTSWTATAPSLPANANSPYVGYLKYVACSSSCMAVGVYIDNTGNYAGLIETGSGSSWAASAAPVPPHGSTITYASLDGVACGTGPCVSVGIYSDASSVQQGVVVSGSGTSFSATEAPLPAGAAVSSGTEATLNDVACTGSTCTAVGSYFVDTTNNQEPLLLTGSGTSWTAMAGPVPSGAAGPSTANAYLNSIACTAGGSCTAVGQYSDTSNNLLPLALTGSGSSWSAAGAPMPSNVYATPNAFLYWVACQPAATCVSSGRYESGASSFAGLLDTVSFPLVTPTVTLALGSPSSPLSGSVSLAASVAGADGQPTGTVTFDNGSGAIAGCTSLALSSTGSASCTVQASSLGAGTHSIAASYSGDFGYAATTSGVSSLTVAPAPVPVISAVSIGLARGFVAPISLTCTAAACTGTITVTARITTIHRTRHVVTVRHHKRIRVVVRRVVRVETIATLHYSLGANTTSVVRIPLRGIAHGPLLAATSHRLAVVVTVTVTGGTTSVTTLSVHEYVAPKKHNAKKK